MLKIQRVETGNVIFSLIGRLDLEKIADINKLFDSEPKGSHLALDLKERVSDAAGARRNGQPEAWPKRPRDAVPALSPVGAPGS